MTILDAQKVDYLWKKLGYAVAKTDTNARKKAPNEAIVSPLLIRGDKIWNQAGSIPTVIPTSNSSIVTVYLGSSAVETTEDGTATADRTWLTGLTDWIPPEFGSTYLVKVYADTTGAADPTSTGTQLFATGSGNDDEWFFDYQAGVLHFIGTNLPSSVNGTNVIYIVGARYTGDFGTSPANTNFTAVTANTIVANTISVGDVTINKSNNTIVSSNVVVSNTLKARELILEEVLGTQYGGTGLASFTQNGVLIAANSSALTFATGTSGKVMQIRSDGVPDFDDVDGGDIS
jgi:hypothetical protein